MPINEGSFSVTRAQSPILIEIVSQKWKKVVHHSNFKLYNDSFYITLKLLVQEAPHSKT